MLEKRIGFEINSDFLDEPQICAYGSVMFFSIGKKDLVKEERNLVEEGDFIIKCALRSSCERIRVERFGYYPKIKPHSLECG